MPVTEASRIRRHPEISPGQPPAHVGDQADSTTLGRDTSRAGRADMTERLVTRGFVGRRTTPGEAAAQQRVPPGQYLTTDFPVLSAGPTPRTPLDRWSFTIRGLVREPVTWTWDELLALPNRDWTVDISCVTKWTHLDMRWRGVS